MSFRVLLAENQAMVRGALSAQLSLEEDIEIVAEASRGDEVLPAALDALPDVALLDIEMPGGDGLSAAGGVERAVALVPLTLGGGGPSDPGTDRDVTVDRTNAHTA